MPFVKPVTVSGEADPVIVTPLLAVTVKLVIADPPLLAGAVKETVALASPAAAMTPVGAFGTVEGVAGLEAVDSADVPIELVAVTLNV